MIDKKIVAIKFRLKKHRLFIILSAVLLIKNYTPHAQSLLVEISPINDEDLKYWQKFQNFTIRNLEKFIEQNQDLTKVESVLYPFCGGDILYPILLFPKAQKITLLSLEPIGVTSLITDSDNKLRISPNIVSLLRRSFMITVEMKKTLSQEDEGIYRVVIEQLSLLGIKFITIENFDPVNQNFTISFTYKGLLRTISYYKLNLINKKIPSEFIANLSKEKAFNGVLIKSTSYSLHQEQFSKIRQFIINNAQIIVQDDTGIPLQELEETYNVKKLGSYTEPYGKEFNKYSQENLRLKSSQEGVVLQCFGYGCGRQMPVVLIAKRRQQ